MAKRSLSKTAKRSLSKTTKKPRSKTSKKTLSELIPYEEPYEEQQGTSRVVTAIIAVILIVLIVGVLDCAYDFIGVCKKFRGGGSNPPSTPSTTRRSRAAGNNCIYEGCVAFKEPQKVGDYVTDADAVRKTISDKGYFATVNLDAPFIAAVRTGKITDAMASELFDSLVALVGDAGKCSMEINEGEDFDSIIFQKYTSVPDKFCLSPEKQQQLRAGACTTSCDGNVAACNITN